MKTVAVLLTLFLAVAAGWFISQHVAATRTCAASYRKDTDELVLKAQLDKHQYCAATYDRITELSSCLATPDTRIPEFLRPYLVPPSLEVERLLSYRTKSIPALQEEHDTTCRDYLDTVFTMPPAE